MTHPTSLNAPAPQPEDGAAPTSVQGWLQDALGRYQVTHCHASIRSALKMMDITEADTTPQPETDGSYCNKLTERTDQFVAQPETGDPETNEDKLRDLCAACYMMVGVLVHDGAPIPTKWLDALSAAANDQPFSTDGLLPFEGGPSTIPGSKMSAPGVGTNEAQPETAGTEPREEKWPFAKSRTQIDQELRHKFNMTIEPPSVATPSAPTEAELPHGTLDVERAANWLNTHHPDYCCRAIAGLLHDYSLSLLTSQEGK